MCIIFAVSSLYSAILDIDSQHYIYVYAISAVQSFLYKNVYFPGNYGNDHLCVGLLCGKEEG